MPHCRALLAICLCSSLSAQSAWTSPWTGVHPGARIDHAMAYDEARGNTVMFGGSSGPITFGDTWTFTSNGSPINWAQQGVVGPTPRTGHAMVYDPARQVVVMFGGNLIGGSMSNETWEWDGSTWTLRTPTTSPPPRSHMAAAPWPALNGVVFLGGYSTGSTPNFWLWDGVDWQDITTADTPNDNAPTMAYHAGIQQLVKHGPGGTAIWNGTAWRSEPGPIPRHGARMVYDTVDERILMFGGNTDPANGIYPNETLVWNGLWADLTTTPTYAPVRERFAMVFDQSSGNAMLYGGIYLGFLGSTSFSDTQLLTPTTIPGHTEASIRGFGFTDDCQYIGGGLFSQTSKPLLYTGGQRAWLNEPFGLYGTRIAGTFQTAPVLLLFGASDQTWNGVPLPVDLSGIGRPDCSIFVEVLGTTAATAGFNVGWPFTIPNAPTLIGSSSYFQMIGISQLGPIFTSNAVEVFVGKR
tara:strand:- start:834 stop:2234 length:1401 start_codon:yes stop_codon:yes gene_type:complete